MDGDVHAVTATSFAVALSWDVGRAGHIDVDLQAVLFNNDGKLVDAVYYNNLKALGLTHSGDETSGAKEGFDEVVWARFPRMPGDVRAVLYIAACHSGGHLRDITNGRMHLLEDRPDNVVASYTLERSEADVDLIGALVRGTDGSWKFHVVETPAVEGEHFIDILEPTIGNYIRRIIPGAPQRIKAAFEMQKGDMVDLPAGDIQHVIAGLGWDTDEGQVDLDVSAVFLNAMGEVRDTCFFGNLSVPGADHSGDNLTGEGEGDDEQIQDHPRLGAAAKRRGASLLPHQRVYEGQDLRAGRESILSHCLRHRRRVREIPVVGCRPGARLGHRALDQ